MPSITAGRGWDGGTPSVGSAMLRRLVGFGMSEMGRRPGVSSCIGIKMVLWA